MHGAKRSKAQAPARLRRNAAITVAMGVTRTSVICDRAPIYAGVTRTQRARPINSEPAPSGPSSNLVVRPASERRQDGPSSAACGESRSVLRSYRHTARLAPCGLLPRRCHPYATIGAAGRNAMCRRVAPTGVIARVSGSARCASAAEKSHGDAKSRTPAGTWASKPVSRRQHFGAFVRNFRRLTV
jgi:hypothetical protein